MTDFNNMPLADQLKALQAGDELHLRGGGWLPSPIKNKDPFINFPDICGMSWGMCDGRLSRSNESPLDIIRVIRPTERKVPEVVEVPKVVGALFQLEMLATKADTISPNEHNAFIVALCRCLQDHFERNP